MSKIDEIEQYFKENGYPEGEIQLYPWAKITDAKKYVESVIQTLRSNPGKKVYMPYFVRLADFYELIKSQNK